MRPDISGAHRESEEPGLYSEQTLDRRETPPASGSLVSSSSESPTKSAALPGSSGLAVKQAHLYESLRVHPTEDAASLEIDPTPAKTQNAGDVPQLRPADTPVADAALPSPRSDRAHFC